MRFLYLMVVGLFLSTPCFASVCPNGDEPPMIVKTKSGPVLSVCGFEDHEVPTAKPKRAFIEFTVYFTSAKHSEPQKVFASDPSDTFWIKDQDNKGLQLEELWFFSDKPQAALVREITCDAEQCQLSGATRCVFKIKPNTYPKALAKFEQQQKKGKFDEDGEELLDQIFAQALTGDAKAATFYAGEMPKGLDSAMIEAFTTNKQKIKEIKDLKCR